MQDGTLASSGEEQKGVPVSEKDRLAAEVERTWSDFQIGLFDKRKYPLQRFTAFWESAKRYAEVTRKDPLIHRSVVVAVNGLTDFLRQERKRIPGSVVCDAERLECLLFSGYDPQFKGDEPPGL
ncbi:MAG TPA: hypothetical protein VN428_08940 [Bryobacteraceae bacterium]|nr:hypothetical protein [Bryobacteraceae bacterium]